MKLSHFFAVIAFVVGTSSIQAQTPINTVPEGIATLNIPSSASGSTSYFSAPLCNDPVYTGAVASLSTVPVSNPVINTTDTITVGDSPAPFTTINFINPAAPYFLKMLSGAQAGRVMQIVAFTSSALTLDTTDGTGASPVALDVANFAVAPGDTFEVFAGDTLGLMFGSTSSTLMLVGGSKSQADGVNVFDRTANRFTTYFFSYTTTNGVKSTGNWVPLSNLSVNANNVIIYPYSAFYITREPGTAASSFVLTGRVAEVSHAIRTPSGATVYDSTGYPVTITFAGLNLVPPNWAVTTTANPKLSLADTIEVWNSIELRFDTYYELQNPTTMAFSWRKVGDTTNTDQSTTPIPANTTISFLKRTANTVPFVAPPLPYSLTN